MIATKETIYTVDEAKKTISVVREFDAAPEQVWKAWTQPELLDQWWAPKPWKAGTQSMDYRDGGKWSYYMQGPDGTRHYCFFNYEKIVPNKFFSGEDGFCDEKGNVLTDFPRMGWELNFNKSGNGTKVDILIKFKSLEDLNKIVEMGFKEGFAMGHQNLDELLAKQKAQ